MSWKMGIYKIVCLLLLLPVLLGGCGASSSLVRYDISGDVESLDPQFADEENEQLVIYNIMEGLMCQLPSGELTNGVIEGYDVSADQLTYTFHLRDGMVWDDADSTPVTAHDFVFAFQRIFNSIYPSPFASLYSAIRNSQQVLSGELDIPRYFVSIYELDEEDDVDDPKCWPKANPNWGISVDPELFASRYEYARASENDMIDFKTKNLNMWCHSLQRWANMPLWLERCRWQVDEDSLKGRLAYGGLDLSSVSDFTAFTLDFPLDDGRHYQMTHCWVPEAMVTQISRQCRIPLRKWIEMGWVTATPGDVIDYDYVVDYLTEAYSCYQIHYIASDRWRIEELVRIMPSWFVDVAYEFSQGMKTMSPTIMDFERAYLEGNVSDGGNECVDWMMSCAETFQDSSGNVKLVKPKKRTEARIDGVITSVMALANAKTNDMAAFSGSVEDMLTAW